MRLCVDYRLAGTPRYFMGNPDQRLMLIPDELRKSVCFVCAQAGETRTVQGTGFFVSVPFEKFPDRAISYLVVARHVISGIIEKDNVENISLRINTKSGNYAYIDLPADRRIWYCHDDPFADVALIPLIPEQRIFDVRTIPLRMIISDKIISDYNINLGDEVNIIGLFHKHYGIKRNTPIVRVGNLAALPEEPVRTRIFGSHVDIDAYLIEARSISGLSGSPVFVNLGQVRMIGDDLHRASTPVWYLLGLVHGHWDEEVVAEDGLDMAAPKKDLINTGIAIVTPASKIKDVLDQSKLIADRRRHEVILLDQTAPTLDTIVSETGQTADNPHHKEDFNELLKAAVKARKSND